METAPHAHDEPSLTDAPPRDDRRALKPFSSLPVLPGGVPFLGHNLEIRNDRFTFLQRVLAQGQGLLRVRGPFGILVGVTDPASLHEVLVERNASWEKSAVVRLSLYPLAGEGLFTSGGELWKRQRKLMAPMFHQNALQSYATDMLACTRRSLETWADGGVVEFAREMTRLTMAVAGKTLFDADTFSDSDEIGAALTTALDWSNHKSGDFLGITQLLLRMSVMLAAERSPQRVAAPLRSVVESMQYPWVLPTREGRALEGAIATLEARVQRMIDDRRTAAKGGAARADLLSRLLAAHDEDGARMSDKQVRDEVLTLFVAGHETTATGLAWTMQLLCTHPEAYEAAQREADALTGEPTLEDLPRLGFLLRCFKEALRLYPPVYFFGRSSIEPTQIGGYAMPRFTNALIFPWVTHRRASEWPDPERFDPDRFLPEREAARPRTAWIPFSAGPRVCIGNHFSMMEAQLVLASMLRNFDFAPLGHESPDPGATLRPAGPMRMRVTRRRPAGS